MNVASIIANDPNTREVSVLRSSVGSFVDGLYVEGAVTAINNVKAIVYPDECEDTRREEEGSRTEDAIRVYVSLLLRASRDENRQAADVIVDADGRRWLVREVEDWIALAGYSTARCVALAHADTASDVFFGAASTFDVNLLSKSVSTQHLSSFVANAETGEFIFYAAPSSFGSVDFSVSGFVGGTALTTVTIGGVSYDVLRSENTGLGETEVSVISAD